MALQWPVANATVTRRDGSKARFLGVCPLTGRRRVQHPIPRDHMNDNFTVWLCTDDGACRGDGASSPCDVVSA